MSERLRIQLAEVHDVHKSRSRYVHFWLVIKHINPDTSLVIKWIHSDRCTRQSYNFAWQLIVRCTQKLLLPTWNFALFWFCRGICFKFWFLTKTILFNKLQIVDRFQSISLWLSRAQMRQVSRKSTAAKCSESISLVEKISYTLWAWGLLLKISSNNVS